MELMPLGKNKTVLYQYSPCGNNLDHEVYFSYSTPILMVDYKKKTVFKNIEKYTVTTSRHMNAFMTSIPPEYKVVQVNELRLRQLNEKKGYENDI